MTFCVNDILCKFINIVTREDKVYEGFFTQRCESYCRKNEKKKCERYFGSFRNNQNVT